MKAEAARQAGDGASSKQVLLEIAALAALLVFAAMIAILPTMVSLWRLH